MTGLSGKLGGQFAQRTGSGLQLSSISRKPRSTSQIKSRSSRISSSVSQLWKKLTDAQRRSWHAIATSPGGGFNVFRQRNFGRLSVNLLPISLPVSPVGRYTNNTLTLVSNVGANILNMTWSPAAGSNNRFVLMATRQMNASRKPKDSDFVSIQVNQSTLSGGMAIFTTYTARFGALSVGKTVHVRIVAVDSASGVAHVAATASKVLT